MTGADLFQSGPRATRGAALHLALVTAAIVGPIAASALTVATLELMLAGNREYQREALRAAEDGIAATIAGRRYRTDPPSPELYDASSAPDPVPRRGSGTPIETCRPGLQCEVFLRFDATAGATPVPGNGAATEAGLRAYHYVVDSYGAGSRGAFMHLQAGFYVVSVDGARELCGPGADSCNGASASPPILAWWRQVGLD